MTTASSVEKRKEIEESHQEAADIPETKKAKVEVAENAGVERRRSGRSKKQVNMKETDNEEENEEEAEEAQTPASKKKKETSKAQLAVGDTLADNLNVLDQNDQEHDLKSLFADKAGVIFFYPKANTPGCTTQACGFRDNYAVFEEHGYQVFGMSADTPKSQSSWKEKHSLPYSLLSDRSKDRHVLKTLGTHKAPTSVTRSHLIFGKGGVVLQVAYGVTPKASFESAVEFVKENKQEVSAEAAKEETAEVAAPAPAEETEEAKSEEQAAESSEAPVEAAAAAEEAQPEGGK